MKFIEMYENPKGVFLLVHEGHKYNGNLIEMKKLRY